MTRMWTDKIFFTFICFISCFVTTIRSDALCQSPRGSAGMVVMPDVVNCAPERSSPVITECPCGDGNFKSWLSTNASNPINAWETNEISQFVCLHNTTNFAPYGYVKAIAVGCGGCDALRSLPCLSGIFSTPPITNITMREPNEPIFNESYCQRPYKDLAGMVMMQAKDINIWPKDYIAPFVKNCTCGEGTLRYWNSTTVQHPVDVFNKAQLAYYFCYGKEESCLCNDPCLCSIEGECYVYADPNTAAKGDWINEETGESIPSPENLTPLGLSSGFIKAAAIGCGGCQALRALPCLSGKLSKPRKILDLLQNLPQEALVKGLGQIEMFAQNMNYSKDELHCLTGWSFYEPTNKCFLPKYCGRTVYLEANNFCREQGGVLASVHGNNENEFITSLAQNLSTISNSKWILGLTKINGDWRFDDGTAFDYTNWQHTAPDGLANEFNVALLASNNSSDENLGKWDDISSFGGQGFICQHTPSECENTSTLYISSSLKTEWYDITQTPLGCKCHSYLVEHTWANKFCLTYENGSLVEEFLSFLEQDHIGISSFNPVITAIGCNGCAELREFDCSNLYTETSYDCLFKDGANTTIDYPEYYEFNDLYYNVPEIQIQNEKIIQYSLDNTHICNEYKARKKRIFYDYVGLNGTILYVCHGFTLGTDSTTFSNYYTKDDRISILTDLDLLCKCCILTEAYLQTTYSLHMLSNYTMTISDKTVGVDSLYRNNNFGLSVLFAYVVGVVDHGI
uniref:C-type lectin domain-containing protein n=1 Tax=Acrobeloides nanus TaxID=290746 RepID=A0A914DSI3_9BILA